MSSNEQLGTRLMLSNVNSLYSDLGKTIWLTFEPRPGRGLLQRDFGKRSDCAITSMASIFGPEHYSIIEQYAKRYGYNGDSWGTLTITIRKIMQKVMDHLGGEYRFKKAKSAYLKNVGVTWELCKSLSERKIPYVLALKSDGRNYYKNHSVTVVGYMECTNGRFLVVYDNWDITTSLIDFNKMSTLCSVVWME